MNKTREYKYEGDTLYLKCTKCLKRYTIDNYPKDKTKRFGTRSDCNECHKAKMKIYHSRWYEDKKEDLKTYFKEYHKINKVKVLKRIDNKAKSNSEKLGFDRYKFHATAKRYVRVHNLRPKQCTICGEFGNIEMHHPSYKSFDEWSKVVFCCKKCHRNIHVGNIKCPTPINLLELV